MRVGFLANTYGNIDYLVLATERLLGALQAERVFFLGGEFTDIDDLFDFRRKLERGTEEYHDEHFLADVASFLAGDGESDSMADYRKKFVRVPEPGSPAYASEKTPNKLLEMVGGNIVLLIHSPNDIVKDDLLNANIIFHGSTHKRGVVKKGNHYFVCPGHLRDKEHEGRAASFGLFELDKGVARVTFHSVSGDIVDETVLNITKKGKITVQ